MKTIEHFLHLFTPRHSNDHKAKIIHNSSIFTIGLVLIAFQLVLQGLPKIGIKILGYASSIPPDKIVTLINQKRQDQGLPALTSNSQLTQAAIAKGNHMLANGYWAHTAPDGTEPWYFFTSNGYQYKYAGENLARDFMDPESAVEAWMASSSHRENILSTRYKETGVAVVEGSLSGTDSTIIVQLFGAKLSDSGTQATIAKAAVEATATPTPKVEATITPAPTKPVKEPISTPTAAVIANVSPEPSPVEEAGASAQVTRESGGLRYLFSPFDTTRGVSFSVIVLLFIVMVIDMIYVNTKKIPRLGGRTLAHLAFLGTILLMIIIAKVGNIL